MSPHLNRPKLSKGRIDVIQNDKLEVAYRIIFQFNPEKITRHLTPQWEIGENGKACKSNFLQLKGCPEEIIDLDIEIDANDQPDKFRKESCKDGIYYGIYPQIAVLEALVYPSVMNIEETNKQMKNGSMKITAPKLFYTLLAFGKKRAMPVQITKFTITEEMHDEHLNPIRAKITMNMRVLSYNDVPVDHPIYSNLLNYHRKLETMAKMVRRK